MDTIQVLFVDDEEILGKASKLYLEDSFDFSVDTAFNGEEALNMLAKSRYDAIISDYDMPIMDGIEFLKKVREDEINIPFIIFTGRGREEVAIDALNYGADFYMQKGGDTSSLYKLLAHQIKKYVNLRRSEDERLQLLKGMEEVIDACPYTTAIINPDFSVKFINRSGKCFFNKYFGESEEFIGKSLYELFSKEHAEEFVGQYKISLSERRQISFKKYVNGFTFDRIITPHFDSEGDLVFYSCFHKHFE